MAKKKAKKKEHWLVRSVKFAVPVAAGAVIGAYTIRFIDKIRAPAGPAAPELEGGDQAALASADPLRSNPHAIAAITPILPSIQIMPQMAPLPPHPYFAQNPPEPPAPYDRTRDRDDARDTGPRRLSAAERRKKAQDDFERLVEEFEKGD